MLTFNLKKEWFEKIKSGEKTHEYRLFNKYWCNRIFNARHKCTLELRPFIVCFACGYPKKDDKEKRLYAHIIDIDTKMAMFTDLEELGSKTVYDIEFELLEAV